MYYSFSKQCEKLQIILDSHLKVTQKAISVYLELGLKIQYKIEVYFNIEI